MSNGRYRRGSRFTGVVLILLGVLFLLHNFRPEIQAWAILDRWWPLLLILWGVARLFENIAARRSGQTPGPVLTGGELFLLVLILVVVGVIGVGRRVLPHIDGDADVDLPFSQRAERTQ
jgi:hypothetical protein